MRIKLCGLCLFALLAAGALQAAGASATGWKLNGSPLTEQKPYTAKGTVEFEEQFNKNNYTCSFSQEGTVGPGGAGTITGKKIYTCTHVSGSQCESAIELEALHLPWKTQLVTVNGLPRDEIKNGGSGEPRWMVKCNGIHGKIEEECTGAATTTGMLNVAAGVKAVFDGESSRGSCAFGGSNTLVLRGSETIAQVGLTVETPEWLLGGGHLEGPVTVASKGTLKLSDAGKTEGKAAVECASAGEVSVGPGAVGDVKHLTFSGCKVFGADRCEAGSTAEAVGLPWRTVLSTAEGATRELISEEGGGAPGFRMNCKILGTTVPDKCTGSTSALMKVATGGVDETFDSKSAKLKCEYGGAGEGSFEGTSLLENPSSGTLTFKP